MKFSSTELKQFKIIEKDEEYNPEKIIGDSLDHAVFLGKIKVSAQAKLIDNNVFVKGEISSRIKFRCVRCLNEFEKGHSTKFQQFYSLEEEIIDLSNEIRESILIDLPLHPVCQINCKGVVPELASQNNPSTFYSEELKSDPRWDQLKKINLKGNKSN